MIGHAFMGAAHSHAWRTAPHVFDLPLRPLRSVLCSRSVTPAIAARLGWDAIAGDWPEVVTRDDIDLVDICVPGYLHEPIAVAALAAGKHVLCEKPLANTLAEASRMAAAAASAAGVGAKAMVGFNYRRVPAIARARSLVADGRIGQVREVRASYLQDWLADPSAPWTWRMSAEQAGSGALGDIGSHIIDLTQYLTGSLIAGVSAVWETFTRERPLPFKDGCGSVTVDDAVAFTARLDTGALATFEASRVATGRKNSLRIELYGTEGSLAFDLERLNELEVSGQRVLITDPSDPYLDAWWPPGHVLGWDATFVHQVRDLVTGIASGTDPAPTFADGLQVQRVLDAVAGSAREGAVWTVLKEGD